MTCSRHIWCGTTISGPKMKPYTRPGYWLGDKIAISYAKFLKKNPCSARVLSIPATGLAFASAPVLLAVDTVYNLAGTIFGSLGTIATRSN